jgi:hypothetical protein
VVVHEPGHALRLDDNLELLDITDVVLAPGLRRPPEAAVAASDTPSQVAAGGELLREFRVRLGEEERRIADLRAAGCIWAEVAAELGGAADARRMQFRRAVERVAQESGPEAGDE